MNVEEIKQKKQELGEKIAVLLNGFEDETGVQVSDVGFVRRVSYGDLGIDYMPNYKSNPNKRVKPSDDI